MSLVKLGIELAERGKIPDSIIRSGIRKLCRGRISDIQSSAGASGNAVHAFADKMRSGPVAPVPEAANEQHYEVPEGFFGMSLGHRRKYSGCFWPDGTKNLDEAEDHALAETCTRAGLEDGMNILELGCGWGSLTLWMGERYPNASITAVSNSASQREYILDQAKQRGLGNINVITCDMNDFDIDDQFDRVVSVEMFEHMRNYELLLHRIAGWLKPDGRLFVHIFVHQSTPYTFETDGASNWMGRHFFTGGIMPSQDIFSQFQTDMVLDQQWEWDGTHYQRTAEGWLKNLDQNKQQVIDLFMKSNSKTESIRIYNRWRIFFLACAETFGYNNGKEWMVGHYLLKPLPRPESKLNTTEAEIELGQRTHPSEVNQ